MSLDRLIYVAMTGAKHIMDRQATVSNNLANVTTHGFRAQIDTFRAVPVIGQGAPTRAFVVDNTVGADFTPGVLQTTGRALDVAINGKGWIAVRDAAGGEAYTRNGSLTINANGLLQTSNGLPVLSAAGTLTIPPDEDINIASDGTVSTVPRVGNRNQVTEIGRIKLVNPDERTLVRGDDGLFRPADGRPAAVDEGVVLNAGTLETSNVSVADALVTMISLARQFDMHVKLLQNTEQNAAKASQLLSMNG